MIEILHSPDHRLVTIRASGRLTSMDYDAAMPELEEAIRKAGGALNAVIDVQGMKGIELGALWKDLKFDVEHMNDFRRIAIVGSGTVTKIGTRASGFLTSATVAFFDAEKAEEARQWAIGH